MNTIQNSKLLPILGGVVIVVLLGALGYLASINAGLRKSVQTEAVEVATTTSDTPTSVGNPEISQIPVITEKKSPAPSASTVTGGWTAFYESLADAEAEFHQHFDFIDWEAGYTESSINLQLKSTDGALAAITKIDAKIAEGKKLFPQQLACLNKDKEAFDSFRIALDNGRKFLNLQIYFLRFDQFENDLKKHLGTFTLRSQNKDYDEALIELNAVDDILIKARANAVTSNTVIHLDGMDDYIKWNDIYKTSLIEIRKAVEEKNENYEPKADFISIGNMHEQAILDISEQIAEWSVKNVASILTAAGQAYAQSNLLCKKE